MSTTFAHDNRQADAPGQAVPESLVSRDEVQLNAPKPKNPTARRTRATTRLVRRSASATPAPRSDAELAQACQEALRWATTLPEQSVRVEVKSGYATLAGEVQDSAQSQTAEEIVRAVPGINDVHNTLRLR